MTKHFLQHFKERLDSLKIHAVLVKADKNNSTENLFIPYDGTSIGISLSNLNQQVDLAEGAHLKINLVQYYIELPIELKNEQSVEVVKFLNELNLISPIPGWYLNHKSNSIQYRYVQVNSNDRYPSDELITYILQVITLYMEQYIPLVVDLCSGKTKYEQVIKKLKVL
ncbi:MAG: hypothetical protein H0X29_03235 [Parachlamydiaceae bacterium]|nr:hypothetical protein [Parachlamydiaceae bacterium]